MSVAGGDVVYKMAVLSVVIHPTAPADFWLLVNQSTQAKPASHPARRPVSLDELHRQAADNKP